MTRLTDEQLERAARKLCELRGVDPDAQIPYSAPPDQYGFSTTQILYAPRWKSVAATIRSYEQLDLALRFGRGE